MPVFGGICHRFPELKFVSVESGASWLPFAIEAFDWQWQNNGVVTEHTYDVLNRRLTATFPAQTAENVAYAYDDTTGGNHGKGRLTSITDSSGSTALVYDHRGNVSAETSVIERSPTSS